MKKNHKTHKCEKTLQLPCVQQPTNNKYQNHDINKFKNACRRRLYINLNIYVHLASNHVQMFLQAGFVRKFARMEQCEPLYKCETHRV